MLAHRLTRRLAEVRKNGTLPFLRPDGKSQVTVEYRDGRPVSVDTVVVSTQHAADVPQSRIREDVLEHVIKPVLPVHLTDFKKLKTHINPTGQFVIGGPDGDTGLTGRKIIVDTYGGSAPHGGGAFSGKDPTKVDRSACYMARYIAKNIVAAGLAHKCRGAAGLRHRRGRSGVGDGGDVRNGHAPALQIGRTGARTFQVDAQGNHRVARTCAVPSIARPRPTATLAARRKVYLGSDQHGRALRLAAKGERRRTQVTYSCWKKTKINYDHYEDSV